MKPSKKVIHQECLSKNEVIKELESIKQTCKRYEHVNYHDAIDNFITRINKGYLDFDWKDGTGK